jgi:hypothetical protein
MAKRIEEEASPLIFGYGELETCEKNWQLQFVWLQDLLPCKYW